MDPYTTYTSVTAVRDLNALLFKDVPATDMYIEFNDIKEIIETMNSLFFNPKQVREMLKNKVKSSVLSRIAALIVIFGPNADRARLRVTMRTSDLTDRAKLLKYIDELVGLLKGIPIQNRVFRGTQFQATFPDFILAARDHAMTLGWAPQRFVEDTVLPLRYQFSGSAPLLSFLKEEKVLPETVIAGYKAFSKEFSKVISGRENSYNEKIVDAALSWKVAPLKTKANYEALDATVKPMPVADVKIGDYGRYGNSREGRFVNTPRQMTITNLKRTVLRPEETMPMSFDSKVPPRPTTLEELQSNFLADPADSSVSTDFNESFVHQKVETTQITAELAEKFNEEDKKNLKTSRRTAYASDDDTDDTGEDLRPAKPRAPPAKTTSTAAKPTKLALATEALLAKYNTLRPEDPNVKAMAQALVNEEMTAFTAVHRTVFGSSNNDAKKAYNSLKST